MTERERRGREKERSQSIEQQAAAYRRTRYSPGQQSAPDALDESRDAVHGVAVVRHHAAHAPLNVHQPPVAACEKQQATLARAVVRKRYLRTSRVRIAQLHNKRAEERSMSNDLHRACSCVGVEVDPAATGGRAPQRNRVGRVRFKSGEDALACIIAHY
jgi:hypothetical protein